MNLKLPFALLGATLAVSLFASSARADESEDQRPIVPGVVDEAGKPLDLTVKPRFKPFAIEANAVDAGIGRNALRGEWMPAVHHAVDVELHVDYTLATETATTGGASTSVKASFLGFGSELGYRFYTGERGPNGLFIGPSVHVERLTETAQGHAVTVSTVGVALDAGAQWIFGPGIVFGVGLGIDYTPVGTNTTASRLPVEGAWLAGGGVRPRGLVAIGFAF